MQIELEKMNTCAGGSQSVTVVSRGSVTSSPGDLWVHIYNGYFAVYLTFKLME
jgi:hypothetical protein